MEGSITLAMPDTGSRMVNQYPSVVKLINSKLVDAEVRDLVQIEVQNAEDLPKVIESVRKNPNIFNVDVSAINKAKVLAAFSTNQCMVCRVLAGTECFLTRSTTTSDGRMQWTMLVTKKSAFKELIESLEKLNADPKLVRLTEIADNDDLTMRQERHPHGLERGYFDHPRLVSLKELPISSAYPSDAFGDTSKGAAAYNAAVL